MFTRKKKSKENILIGYNKKFIIIFNTHSRRVIIADATKYELDEVYKYVAASRPKDIIAEPVYFNLSVNTFEDYMARAERRSTNAIS